MPWSCIHFTYIFPPKKGAHYEYGPLAAPVLGRHLLWWSFQVRQLQLVLPSLSYPIVSSALLQGSDIYAFFHLLILLCVCWDDEVHYSVDSFLFLLTITRSSRLAEISWSVCISKSRELCVFHFPGQILGCAYTTCSYGQIWISCTISSGSPFPPSCV